MDNNRYMDLFAEESKEHIQVLNDNLLELEVDTNNLEAVNEIFRAAHTLKGMAGTLGLHLITDITHNMENILDDIRNQKKEVTSQLIDILLECTDTLDALVQDVIEFGRERDRDVTDLLSKLKDPITSPIDATTKQEFEKGMELDEYQLSVITAGMEQGLTPYWIEVRLQPTCLLKAARAYMVFQASEIFGEIIKSVPHVQDIEEEKFEDTFYLLLLAKDDQANIQSRLESISEIDSVKIKKAEYNLEKSFKKIEDKNTKIEDKQQKNNGPSHRQARSIRVDIERLDLLMNLVSELIIIKNTMEDLSSNNADSGMTENMEYLSRVANELHDAVMKVRMVPIEMVFNRFPRVVRDLAKNTHKRIKLNIVGADTEVDRTIIDEIGDPLIHLLRNAIDHGIELPEERIKTGKDPEGTVDLIAYHDGNNVVIEVKDDGRGINYQSIVDSAISKGLITEDKASQLGEKDIIDLMFQPGFSTAESVSDISGRGVGMDVVKTKIEAMGGLIEVETELGKGTRFIVRLPLTLSIIQALLVEVSNEIFAIPLSSVQEIIDISLSDVKVLRGEEVITYRGALIPLVRLERELEIESDKGSKDEVITLVVIKKGEKLSALTIGDLIGQQEIVIKSLGKYLSNIKIISGATILGDGRVALILDINRLA
ncbi:MAG: chemotaxis protein CheA [Clostridiales bacterium]|nr:chemotaxis protein CheA [Clostridiales bacterium]